MQVEVVNAPKSKLVGVIMFEGEEAKKSKEYGASEFKAKPNGAQVVVAGSEKKVIFAGLGKKEQYSEETLKKTVAKIAGLAVQLKAKELTIDASSVDNSVSAVIE